MRDLTSFSSMKLKAALFVVIGVFSGILLVFGSFFPAWQRALLLAMCIWAFCRAYYFAFYVIEKYVDPSFRFSGLGAAVKYLLGRKQEATTTTNDPFTDPPPTGTQDLPARWWLLWLLMVALASIIPLVHLRENVRELIEPLRHPWGLLPISWLGVSMLGKLSWYVLAAGLVSGAIAWSKPSWGRVAILSALALQLTFTSLHLLYTTRLVLDGIKYQVMLKQASEVLPEPAPSTKE